MVPAPIRMATVEPTRTLLRNRARSSIGTATRFSTATNATPEATATARQPRVAAETQPQSAPLLTASTKGIRVRPTSRLPAKSMERGRSGSRDSVTLAAVSAMQTSGDSGVHPEQRLPVRDLDQDAAEQWPGSGTDGRGRTPERDRFQLALARVGDRQQAQAARQDRRPGGTLDDAAGDHHAPRVG